VLTQARGESERQQIVQAARPGHGIHRARDVFVTDVADFFACQIFFDREGVEFFDKSHDQATSAVTDTPKSTLTGGKGNRGAGRDWLFGDGTDILLKQAA
jgi:hypothetical protein